MTLPQHGVTVREHVEALLINAEAVIGTALLTLQHEKRIRPARREALRRELAGVIADCETVRVWLDAGAPDVTFTGTD